MSVSVIIEDLCCVRDAMFVANKIDESVAIDVSSLPSEDLNDGVASDGVASDIVTGIVDESPEMEDKCCISWDESVGNKIESVAIGEFSLLEDMNDEMFSVWVANNEEVTSDIKCDSWAEIVDNKIESVINVEVKWDWVDDWSGTMESVKVLSPPEVREWAAETKFDFIIVSWDVWTTIVSSKE